MKPTAKTLLTHLGIFVSVCLILLIGLSLWMNAYTRHNQAIRVPDVTLLNLEEAKALLSAQTLRVEVIDSVHEDGQPSGVVLRQTPAANAKVKQNRLIFLTINSQENQYAPVPYVRDYSQRQAVATIEGSGFKVARVKYVPSQFRNLVVDVLHADTSLQAGCTLPVGSEVSLVVGLGRESDKVAIPELSGYSLDSALLIAHEHNFNIGDIHYDESPLNDRDAALYFVYSQNPTAGTLYPIGRRIDIWMSKNASMLTPDSAWIDAGVEFFE